MCANSFVKMMEDVEKNRARDLGMDVGEYREMIREKERQRKAKKGKERQRKAEEEHYLNSEQYVLDMKKKKDS